MQNYIVTINTNKQYRVEAESPDSAKDAAQKGDTTPTQSNETVNVRPAPAAAPARPNQAKPAAPTNAS